MKKLVILMLVGTMSLTLLQGCNKQEKNNQLIETTDQGSEGTDSSNRGEQGDTNQGNKEDLETNDNLIN